MLAADRVWTAPPGHGGEPPVRDWTLAIDRGDWVAVTGPNGGGKTTLALTLAGLWPARSGTVTLDGHPFGPGAPPELRARVAVVLQDPGHQILQRTVLDEIAFAARNLGRSEARIRETVAALADALGIAPVLERDPRELSAGWQQSVLLAAALVTEPDYLVVDEGGAHLDAERRALALGLVGRLVDRGLGVLWVTQNEDEVRAARRSVWIGDEARTAPISGPPEPSVLGKGPGGPPFVRVQVSPTVGDTGPRVAVDRVLDLEFPRAGAIAFVGRNGGGKSVLLAALAGAIELPQIRVWRGESESPPLLVTQYPEHQIFAEIVDEEVVYAAHQRGRSRSLVRADACAALRDLGLDPQAFIRRRTSGLSTGEKRLIGVVGGLVAPGSILALDEPTCGVDADRRERLAVMIRREADRRLIVMATQDPDWARMMGARLVPIGVRQDLPEKAKSQ